jgi:DNA-binding HxlR family transcriptional regulator
MQPMADSPSTAPPLGALDEALSRIGDRWSLLVVAGLLDGPRRFGELQTAVPTIATNVLTQRLRALVANRIVVARPYSQRPMRSAYELSATGRELAGALRLLAQWGADAAGSEGTGGDTPVGLSTPTHRLCGTPLEVRWWCPTCDQQVDEAGGDEDGPLLWA